MSTEQPSERGFAKLLNLTIEEYRKLKHAPLIAERNVMGAIVGYFMHISPDNNADLLRKVIIVNNNFIWFSVNQVMLVSGL